MDIITVYGIYFVGLAALFGLYMTWGIGANDVANAMGTSVGSGAITVKQAIIIAAIFEFAGVILAGGHVTETVRKGIIDPTPIVDQPELLIYGMLASLLAAGVWLMIASAKGWPVSTTHSIIGALVGFAIVGIGQDAVHWDKVGQIAISWVVSPLVGGTIALLLMWSIRYLILNTDTPFENAKKWGPAYVFLVGFLIALVTLFKGLKHLNIELTTGMSFFWSFIVGLLVAGVAWYFIRNKEIDPLRRKGISICGCRKGLRSDAGIHGLRHGLRTRIKRCSQRGRPAGGCSEHCGDWWTSRAKSRSAAVDFGPRRIRHCDRPGYNGLPGDAYDREENYRIDSDPWFFCRIGCRRHRGASLAYRDARINHPHPGRGRHGRRAGPWHWRTRLEGHRKDRSLLDRDIARWRSPGRVVFLHHQGYIRLTFKTSSNANRGKGYAQC